MRGLVYTTGEVLTLEGVSYRDGMESTAKNGCATGRVTVATDWLGGVVGGFALLGLDGDADFYCCAFGAGANIEVATHVADAFAHAGDTYSGQLIARPKFRH